MVAPSDPRAAAGGDSHSRSGRDRSSRGRRYRACRCSGVRSTPDWALSRTFAFVTMEELIGRRVRLAGHFAGAVLLEDAEPLGDGAFKLRVRTAAGQLDETFLTEGDLLAGVVEPLDERYELVPGADLFDFVEARRIQLAYAHDPT